MRRKHVIFFIIVMFLTWNMLMYYTLVNKSSLPERTHGDVKNRLDTLQEEIKVQLKDNERMLEDLRKLKEETEKQRVGSVDVVAQVPNRKVEPNNTKTNKGSLVVQSVKADSVILPVLLIACDRKDAVVRSLDLVLKYRPDEKRFPIIVSQDCGHKETADTIQKYVTEHKVTHIQQPDLSKIELPWPQRKFEGYYKIARHYKWALNQVFHKFNHSAVIIIEDDLDISPDFFEYFAATFRVLSVDDSLWCVSAWNDNGKEGMIENDPESLKKKPKTLASFFEDIEWALDYVSEAKVEGEKSTVAEVSDENEGSDVKELVEKSSQENEVSDEDEGSDAKDLGEKPSQGNEVSDEDEGSDTKDLGEKPSQGNEVSDEDEGSDAKDLREKPNQGNEVSDEDEGSDTKDLEEKSNKGNEVSDEDEGSDAKDLEEKPNQGNEVSDEDEGSDTKDLKEKSNQGNEVSDEDEGSDNVHGEEKSNQGDEVSVEDEGSDTKDLEETSNQRDKVSVEDEGSDVKDLEEKSYQRDKVSGEDEGSDAKDLEEKSNQRDKVSVEDEGSDTKDLEEKSNQRDKVSGEHEGSDAKDLEEKSNQRDKVSGEDVCSDAKDRGEKSNQGTEVSDEHESSDNKDLGEKSNQGNELLGEDVCSDAKDLGEKSNRGNEVSDEDVCPDTKDLGEKPNHVIELSEEDEDSDAKNQGEKSNQAKDSMYEKKQEITKHKKYENEGGRNETRVKRIRSESEGDSVKKKIKLTENTCVISDSEEDSTQSEVFPFLSGIVVKVRNQPDSDTDDGDENEQIRFVTRDINHRDIYISCAEKSLYTKSGKRKKTDRKYNARHVCPFCTEKQSDFSHHINSKKHENTEEMKRINSIKNNEERKREIDRLRCKGDHENNLKVLAEKKGEIILMRRLKAKNVEMNESDDSNSDSEVFDVSRYGPCPKCFGWVVKKSLRKHANSCSAFTNDVEEFHWSNRALEVQSDMICGKIPSQASQLLVNEVFPIMRGDHVSEIAKNDNLIINLGNQWMMRNRRNRIMRKYYTSTVMRLASKLKLACQKLSGKNLDMEGFLSPVHFETVIKAALFCCHISDVEEDLQAPSNSIKLGFDIKRMVNGKLSKAIIADDHKLQKEATDFQRLMEIEWCLRVTKLARGILEERSYNKTNELPRPADVRKLYEYLQDELNHTDLNDKSSNNFRQVAMLTLARLTLYNRRRCHEVQAMRLVSYAARTTGVDEIGLDMRKELTKFEQHLLTTQEMVVIRGKTGKGVPVILPPDVTEPMKFLTDANVRRQAGKEKDNEYVFASRGLGVFRAYEAIREVSQSPKADLQMPDLIRTSNMRKYMATMLQALNTTEAERQWVMDHLGHTMNVHRIHYRQTSDVLERIDVAKILLIQDLGLVSKYSGKTLQDIQIEELLHRTDFFPGLGWMFERKLWLELGPKWPPTFWDDWMRHQDQRLNRSCIRPEISRTSTFGKKGVSKGLFFDKHLKFIHLNDKFVPFTQKDLSYLIKENYDPAFNHAIYSVEEIPLGDVLSKKRSDMKEIRVTYKTKDEFKNAAKKLGIMDDFKAGVERTAYRGVVSFTLNGQRIYLAPPQDWKGYDTSWT